MARVKQKIFSIIVAVAMLFIVGAIFAFCGGSDIASAADDGIRDTNVINLSDTNTVHWAISIDNWASSSNLRDGRIYIYSYLDSSNAYKEYFSVVKLDNPPASLSSVTNWNLSFMDDVKLSIVRARSDENVNYEIGLFGSAKDNNDIDIAYPTKDEGDTVDKYTRSATAVGMYRAKAVLTAKNGKKFSLSESSRATLSERGIEVEINSDGTIATMIKVWYVAQFDNALLNGGESVKAGTEVEFTIPSWKFGEYKVIEYPWLYHGDGALNEKVELSNDYNVLAEVNPGTGYQSIVQEISRQKGLIPAWDPRESRETQKNDLITFDLRRQNDNGDSVSFTNIAEKALRSDWSYYINGYMPAGNYELVIHVKTIQLTTHKHWWDGTEHVVDASNPAATEEFQGFNRTFNFSVLPGDLTITNNSDISRTDAQKVDIDTIKTDGFAPVFAYSENKFTYSYKIGIDEVKASATYWAEHVDDYFEKKPHLEYNLYRMQNDKYFTADSTNNWMQYITSPDTYVVYYMAKMKNYASYPSMENRRDYNYQVIVYRNVAKPSLNRKELVYTGGELSVAPKDTSERDTRLYDWTGNSAINAGDYTVTFTLNDSKHYKWLGNDDFTPTHTENWTIKPAQIAVPEVPERTYSGNPQKPLIPVQLNQVTGLAIYSISYPSEFANERVTNAGTYSITLTLNNTETVKNYEWSSGDDDKDGSVTVVFKMNPETNRWKISPRITQWEWNGYKKDVNIIECEPMHGTVNYFVSFDREGNRKVSGLENFTTVDQNISDALAKLDSGSYYLHASVTAPERANYTNLSAEPVKFDVSVARNFWKTSPNIIRWKYGSFDASVNLIQAIPNFGTGVTFSIISNRGNSIENDACVLGLETLYLNSEGEAQGATAVELAKLECGKTYWLRAIVNRTPYNNDAHNPLYNYTEMIQYVEFHIQQSNNYWTTVPNIERWVSGEDPKLPIGEPMWGDPAFVIFKGETDQIVYDSKNNVNTLADAQPGWYRLEATVAGNANYTSLSGEMRFKIFSTDRNFWNIVPNIQGWTEGGAHNAPVGKSAFGEITYTYYTRADFEDNGVNARKLDGIPTVAGDYVMVATAVSDAHEDLVAAVKFTIYKDVSVTAKTYLTIIGVFSGVIVVGIVLSSIIIVKQRKKFKKLASANSDAKFDVESNAYEEPSFDGSDDSDIMNEDMSEAEAFARHMDDGENVVEVDAESDGEDGHDDTPAIEPTFID